MTVRFDLDNEKDAAAWTLIHRGGITANQAVLDAILQSAEKNELSTMIENAVIRGIQRSHIQVQSPEPDLEEKDDNAVLSFLDSFSLHHFCHHFFPKNGFGGKSVTKYGRR